MIVIRDLNALDQISISTQNSQYQFQVLEPGRCRGVLSGGRFGDERFEAILTGAIRADRSCHRISAELEVGDMCALLHRLAREPEVFNDVSDHKPQSRL
jgi:hypothetical protein